MLNLLTKNFDFHASALELRAERQKLLASNIANADTPNYKARDLDFPATMAQLQSAKKGETVSVTAAYRVSDQASTDGNTVDMDRERANFLDNSLRYESTLRFMNSSLRHMLTAIKGE